MYVTRYNLPKTPRMDIEKLKIALSPWVRVNTWHTGHPCDAERFHRALKSAFDTQGTSIGYDDFKEAIEQLAAKHHPTLNLDYLEKHSDKFALKAEIICNYLQDNAF